MREIKRCSKCGEWKEEGEFYKSKRDGRQYKCKQCQLEYQKKRNYDSPYYQNNKERVKAYREKYRVLHPELHKKMKIYRRKYRALHSDATKKSSKKFRKLHSDAIKKHRKYESLNLTDRYIKRFFVILFGLKFSEITPQMIQTKREQIMVHRALKQLKEVINE